MGRNRNERRLLGYIYQSLTVDVEVPNLEVAGSNPAGRASPNRQATGLFVKAGGPAY